jgi:single-strand DNA-binding protein
MSNTISMLARLGKDAETRNAGNGTVTGFSCASDVGFGDRKTTMWFSASIWGARGEKLQQHLTKGTLVFISGELSTREYNDKTYLELNVSNIDFAGGNQSSNGGQPAPQRQENLGGTGEDVPF